jgi:acyl carrier protein
VQFIASDVASGGGALDAATDLVMTGLIDSLGVMMVVDWLEQRLDISIDPNDVVIEHFESVDAIVGYLHGRDDCRFE